MKKRISFARYFSTLRFRADLLLLISLIVHFFDFSHFPIQIPVKIHPKIPKEMHSFTDNNWNLCHHLSSRQLDAPTPRGRHKKANLNQNTPNETVFPPCLKHVDRPLVIPARWAALESPALLRASLPPRLISESSFDDDAPAMKSLYSARNPDPLSAWSFRQCPRLFSQTDFALQGCDKIFASCWIAPNKIVFGSKCHRLVVLDTISGMQVDIPEIQFTLPFASAGLDRCVPLQRLGNRAIVDHRGSVSFLQRAGLTTDQELPQGATLDGHTLLLSSIHDPILATLPIWDTNFQSHNRGIHSISSSPSKHLIAIGTGKPTDTIQIYSLPAFEPVAVLVGHSDMVFSVAWLSDTRLMSVSRDKTVKFWTLSPDSLLLTHQNIAIYQPSQSIQDRGKVRDLEVNRHAQQAASLSSDGYVKLWDTHTSHSTSTVALFHTSELVCMAQDSQKSLFAVGSQSHIELVDPRSSSVIHNITSLDEGWGVRSLLVEHGVLMVGGGMGRISFYDLCAQKYLDWSPTYSPNDNPISFLQSSQGWLHQDESFLQHFRDDDIYNSVYTLSYDQDQSCLFSAGGPLQMSLKGSYAGLWKI